MGIVREALLFYQMELSGNKRGDQDLLMPVYLLLQCRCSWHNPLLCFWVHYSARLSVVSCPAICFTVLVGAKILYSTQAAVILRSVYSRPLYFCQQAVVSACTSYMKWSVCILSRSCGNFEALVRYYKQRAFFDVRFTFGGRLGGKYL